ncbi:hypothetical protein J4453_00805 [Candidatus Woesearchaeota archaeon]|nr:hypothetical protein [Candidatus Woesearchaeota archaeon]
MSLSRNGQLVISDLFIAVFVFMVLLISSVIIWDKYSVQLSEDTAYKEIGLQALQVSDLLVKTPGMPNAWEQDPSTVERIGLANHDRNLSEEKLNAFLALNYSVARDMLSPLHHFYFQLKYLNGSDIIDPYGAAPNGTFIFPANRLVRYHDEEAILRFTVWE